MHGTGNRNPVVLLAAVGLMLMAAPAAAGAETLLWTRTYNGSASSTDVGYGVAVGGDGSVFVVGGTDTATEGRNVILRKYSGGGGTLVWTRTYNGPANLSDEAFGVALAADGSVYVSGVTEDPVQGDNLLLLKYSATGKLLWRRTFSGLSGGEDVGHAVAVAPDGNVYVAGCVDGADLLLQKYSPAGERRWSKVYQGPGGVTDRARGVAVGRDGAVSVAGVTEGVGQGDNVVLLRYSPAGALLWSREYDGVGSGHDAALGIAVGKDGSLYVAGRSEVTGQYDLLLLKYLPSGEFRWARTFGGAAGGADQGNGVAVGADGSIFVAGSISVAGQGANALLRKYSASGAPVWNKTFSGAANGDDNGFGVATGVDGSVSLAGDCFVAGQGGDLLVRRYR